jgi:hypothetical protein
MEALIGTMLGAVIVGGAAYFILRRPHRHYSKEDQKKFFLGKLEQIYEVSADIRDLYRKSSEDILRYIVTDEGSKSWKETRVIPLQKMKMLVAFYAPQLDSYMKKVEAETVHYRDAIPEALKSTVGSNAFVSFQAIYRQLDKALESLQDQVSELSKKYTKKGLL